MTLTSLPSWRPVTRPTRPVGLLAGPRADHSSARCPNRNNWCGRLPIGSLPPPGTRRQQSDIPSGTGTLGETDAPTMCVRGPRVHDRSRRAPQSLAPNCDVMTTTRRLVNERADTQPHTNTDCIPIRSLSPAVCRDLSAAQGSCDGPRLRPGLLGDRRLAGRIAAGERTTWEYARFCSRRGVAAPDGVFCVGRPDPFAYRRPVQCRQCGEIFETDALVDNPIAAVCVLAERWGDPQVAEPAEWLACCPSCAARESFTPAVVCEACGDFPCTCREHDDL